MTLYGPDGRVLLPQLPADESWSPHQKMVTFLSDLIGFCIGGSPSHLAVSVMVAEVRRNATRKLKEHIYVAERPAA